VDVRFTPAHRGGDGPPLVLLHGFLDTWRSWELVLDRLERHHDVLAPTLAGHAGGPPLPRPLTAEALADAVERAMDDAGLGTAHLVGNSLGGFTALQLAARGRARSVVAFAPAGGWPAGDTSYRETLALQARLHATVRATAPLAASLMDDPRRRRAATELITVRWEHLPAALLAHQAIGMARCDAEPMLAFAAAHGYTLDAEHITCPVRLVWGTEDRLLPWPATARRFTEDWLPQADVVVLDGVGHCPQLDVPLEAAELVLGWTGG
jgi:pimeloyl-ACP methyl ester carboxylesterase